MGATGVVVAVASGRPDLAARFIAEAAKLAGDRPFYVISEFQPAAGTWIPYRLHWPEALTWERVQADLAGLPIYLVCVLLEPKTPILKPMRHLAFRLAPTRGVYFNEHLNHFMLRPRSAGTIARHLKWRLKSWLTFEFNPGGRIYTWAWRLTHPQALERPWLYWQLKRRQPRAFVRPPLLQAVGGKPGISVIIPSRNGKELLARCLPLLLAERPQQVIIVDNGSGDGTLDWLAAEHSSLEVVYSAEPLSFSAAINRGLTRVRYELVCLLNNDMEVEPGFLPALAAPFAHTPELFASTAQIFFPEGQRREETGKAVLPASRDAFQFPLRCDLPLPGEDGSPVLYGSGGCTLFSTLKLRQLGGLDEAFTPAYVEDFDLGVRAWQRGWATVFTAGARVLHRHRSTTSRYFTPDEIQLAVERNYLRSVAKNGLYGLWREAIERLNRQQNLPALRFAMTLEPTAGAEELAAGSGDIVRFPGRGRQDGPRLRIASCYAPYPLSHGGAVRMYNLMRRAEADFSQTLLYFADQLAAPPPELLDICAEVIIVRRHGTHLYPDLSLPDPVQEFASAAFRAALDLAAPAVITQLEFTQMAQYAPPQGAILVEHDVTIDLYQQLAERATAGTRWELERQLALWHKFETAAWQRCSRVVVMSERDRATVSSQAPPSRVAVLPNGVDIQRYQPSLEAPAPGRLLFIGSFAHLPNLMAIQWFVEQVWPALTDATLHVIAGARPEYYRAFYRDRAAVNLEQAGIELEGFVSDVRPAYRQAQIVIAPLLASAGTNIKILEAMAMGKAIVSTPAGIHGLDLNPGTDVVVVETASQMADAIRGLMADPARVAQLGAAARTTVLERYNWDRIADEQRRIYQALIAEME